MSEERRRLRHESHAQQTWHGFLRDLRAVTNLDEETATRAAGAVLCHLEQRLTGDEVKDLESQLPSKLRELLADSCPFREEVHKLHREDLVACVAADLDRSEPEAEGLVRAVFATVRNRISAGEAEDVAAQLPRDLKPLWLEPM